MPDLVESSPSRPVTLVFAGRLLPESFAGFVAHRAGRLALPYRVESLDSVRAVVTVSGQPDLVDAFEMACSLGPADCLVLDTRRTPAAIAGAGQ
jgi:hypothetical protein